MPETPELIAHRGASRERPENTLAAFDRAVQLGADAVELDVHLSSDGHLVVNHDPTIAEGWLPRALRSMTLAEIQAARSGDRQIPTLDEVVARIGGAARIYCELKGAGTAGPSVAVLARLGDHAAVHSFDHRMIAEARTLAPNLARGVLEASYHCDPCHALLEVGARDLWQNEALIDAALVAAAHACGARVIAWTVDSADRAAELAALGVDGLCTNDVAGLSAVFPERRTRSA